jgi:uncharacterized protein
MAAIDTPTPVDRYEYKFVRVGEYRGSALFGVRDSEREAYQAVVHEQARRGWRLVQIFAPGTAAFGAARHYELIFERPWPERNDLEMERFAGKYLSLTSFKRDGTGVQTPVWFASDDGHLLVETDADSYKVKRIRRDPHVRIALCDARGRLHGDSVEADARILSEDERERVERLLAQKYRIDRYTILPIYRLVMRLRGRSSHSHEPPVALEITPR